MNRTGWLPKFAHTRLLVIGMVLVAATMTGIAVYAQNASAALTSIDDTTTGTGSNQFDFHGTWTQETDTSGVGAYNNTDTYSDTTNDYYLVRFTGVSITLYDVLNSGGGQASAQICNSSGGSCGTATTFNDYSATRTGNQQVYTSGTLTSGSYSLKVTVTGVNGTGGYHYLAPDRVVVNDGLGSNVYYINNASGSGCSDSNNGTSTLTPWCDFANVDTMTFGSGDQILLDRGDTWTSGMTLAGTGTSSSWITVDAYGTGNRPAINMGGSVNDICVYAENLDYWNINDLDLSGCSAGIGIEYTSLSHQGLSFTNDYVHGTASILFGQSSTPPTNLPGMHYATGIYISSNGAASPGSGQWIYKGVTVTNLTATGVDDAFEFGANGLGSTYPNYSVQNVTVQDSSISSNGGCPLVENTTNFRLLDSTINGDGGTYQGVGTTGLWFWDDENAGAVNNVIANTPSTSSADETGSDTEAYNDHIHYQGNFIGGNAGPGIEILGLGGRSGDAQTNHDLSDNVFQGNDGQNTNGTTSADIELGNYSGITMSGAINDNIYTETNLSQNVGGSSNTFTFSDNVSPSGGSGNVYDQANQFSSTQGTNDWGYQLYTGTSWSNLSYNSTNNYWGSSSSYVNEFESLPDATSGDWIAHTWTAPQSGTVDVRGRVLKADIAGGDGVNVRITQNGTQIWPTTGGAQAIGATDQTGYATDLDSISVNSGDVIRFEVNDGGSSNNSHDLTSWNPSIAYTSTGGTSVDDTTTGTGSNQFDFHGTWTQETDTSGVGAYNNTDTYSDTTNDYYLVRFTGVSITLYDVLNSGGGQASAQICNSSGGSCGTATTFNDYSATRTGNQQVYTSGTLTSGSYSLKVTVTGVNGTGGYHYLAPDRVVVN